MTSIKSFPIDLRNQISTLAFLGLCLFSLISLSLKADDELVLIQAVSTSGKTFVIRKGAEEGVATGQESLFSTRDSSFTAVAVEANRFFSLWRLKDNRGAVPFAKNEFVTFTNNIESVWTELPKLQLAPKEELVFKQSYGFLLRTNFSYAMSETVSNIDDEKTASRVGYQLEVLYGIRFAVHWETIFGFRFDRENATLQDPALDVPTNRYMVAGELIYHFENFARSDNNAYLGIGLAYGLSNTTVEDAVSTGTTAAIPIVKLGYINRISPNYSLVFEGSIESLSQKEAYTDTGDQTTNITNSKISIGLRL